MKREYSESHIDDLRRQVESIMNEVEQLKWRLEEDFSISNKKWEKIYDPKFMEIQVHLNDLLENIY
jgi:hypothetical protein